MKEFSRLGTITLFVFGWEEESSRECYLSYILVVVIIFPRSIK